MADIIKLNRNEIKAQLTESVRRSVGDTLNALLDAETDQITQEHEYERTEKRLDTRAGHYNFAPEQLHGFSLLDRYDPNKGTVFDLTCFFCESRICGQFRVHGLRDQDFLKQR